LFDPASREIKGPAEVARGLGMSERTLKRKLAEQGTSYSELLDRERHSQAVELLRGAASIDDVAERLGYSDAANFTRAFRRWTGRSPRVHRAET
jgi:AraC-like DNA-binding protein